MTFDQTDDGSLFIAMEHLSGEKLTDVIHRDAPLEMGRASHLGIQISEGLEAAHHAGVIHRDIKPDNIMVLGTRRFGRNKAHGLWHRSAAG